MSGYQAPFRDVTYKLSGTSATMWNAVRPSTTPGRPVAEWPSWTREVFGRLYRPEDQSNALASPEAWASKAHGLLEQQADWPMLRAACAGNALVAGDAAEALDAAVAAVFADFVDDMNPDPAQAEADFAAFLRAAERFGFDELAVEAQRLAHEAAMRAARARRHALAQGFDREAASGRLGAAVATAAAVAKESAERMTLLAGFGVEPGRHVADAKVDQQIAALLRDSKGLQEILRAMGAMLVAKAKRDSDKGLAGRCDVVGVHPGRDLARLTSAERTRLAHPTLRADVLRRSLDGSAQTWEMKGSDDDRDRGDVIVCVDRSGSMQGGRYVWARALAAASLALAAQEKRRAVLVLFSNRASTVIVDPAAPTHKADLLAALGLLQENPAGGTDAAGGLSVALSHALPTQPPDVLVVTDDQLDHAAMDAQARTVRARKGKVHAVLLGGGTAATWADSAADLSQLVDQRQAPKPAAVDEAASVLGRLFGAP